MVLHQAAELLTPGLSSKMLMNKVTAWTVVIKDSQ